MSDTRRAHIAAALLLALLTSCERHADEAEEKALQTIKDLGGSCRREG